LRKALTKTVMGPSKFAKDGELGLGDLPLGAFDEAALAHLFSSTYEELRRLASSVRRRDPNATLSPTDLVHEAWLKLASSPGFIPTSKLHFKRIAARAMRQVLIEAARRRSSQKRGGPETVVFSTDAQELPVDHEHILALDAALTDLARVDPQQAQLVEGRFFGGLDVAEMAELLGCSESKVLRDWRAAKAWLAAELR
jgi:RNA polymerase sigma-70 factor, ECF subfamily